LVAVLYNMLDYQDPTNIDKAGMPLTVRSVFILDPKNSIRLMITYPASTGRNFNEILRVVDSLQLSDKSKVCTPVNWLPGDEVRHF
jgi:alkyl hydroperoxide reductase subunit AhpC